MKNILWNVLFASILVAHTSQCFAFTDGENERYKNLLLMEFREHPKSTIQDFYKFIHQSAMGPGHWKMDFEMAIQYLNSEIRTLHGNSAQQLCQFLSPDSELVRINLVPYIAMNGNIDSLADAFVKTSNTFTPSESAVKKNLDIFSGMVKDGTIPFNTDSVRLYLRKMKENHYPAVHHSQLYQEQYAPAYRVVYRKYLPLNIYNATHKN